MCNRIKEIDELNNSPMFKLSLSSKELFHSNFLEWLSIVDREAFVKLINKMANLEEGSEWPKNWRVKREFQNFDLCVVAYDEHEYNDYNYKGIEDEDNIMVLFVIENKVKSIPYKTQLDDYSNKAEIINKSFFAKQGNAYIENRINNIKDYWIGIKEGEWVLKVKKNKEGKKVIWDEPCSLDLKANNTNNIRSNKTSFINDYVASFTGKIHYVLLSLATCFPDKDNINTKVWSICNYNRYAELIKSYFLKEPYDKNDLSKRIIEDYISFINNLSNLASKWMNDFNDDCQFLSDNVNYLLAKRLRIHDLYQKLKYSFLCTKLYNSINDEYGKQCKVFPSNQGGLFKKKNFTDDGNHEIKKYICVNYTYLHGDPLLEINFHPGLDSNGVDMYYTIQVQSNAYERGIQVKRFPGVKYDTKRNKDDIASYVWKRLTGKITPRVKIVPGWMRIDTMNSWLDTTNCDNNLENSVLPKDLYNAYNEPDSTYLYQKKLINSNATINKIVEIMLSDLKYVIDKI